VKIPAPKKIPTFSYLMAGKLSGMKTLAFERDGQKDRVTVACAEGPVSVHSKCSFCRHCKGVYIGKRMAPSPQADALNGIRSGTGADENLMNAAMMFNTLVRDGQAIACDDDAMAGFAGLY
jgi:hypothetical protein